MDCLYEIPADEQVRFHLGEWVEIFATSEEKRGEGVVRVRAMRVAGKTCVFGRRPPLPGVGLRPHEGEVAFIDHGPSAVRFRLRLRPLAAL